MMSQGDRIKFIRGALTQKEFAARLGITAQAVINYERHGRVPSRTVLNKILNVYNVSPEWLLTGEGEMHAPADEPLMPTAMVADGKRPHVEENVAANVGSHDVELIRTLRENADLLRQNGDLRVEVERLRMDVERRDARIAELERQLVEALKPQNGQTMLGKRSAAAG